MQISFANPFLEAIFGNDTNKSRRVRDVQVLLRDDKEYFLLVPQTESFAGNERATGLSWKDFIDEEFIVSNREKNKESKRIKQYVCANGRTLVIKDDIVYPHKGIHQTRLLEDTTIYLEHSKSFAFYIDRPLIGTISGDRVRSASVVGANAPSKALPVKLHVKAFTDVLIGYPKLAKAVEPNLRKLLKAFNERQIANQHFDITRLKREIEITINAATEIFSGIPHDLKQNLADTSDLDGDAITDLLETYVMHHIYDIVFFRLSVAYQDEDAALYNVTNSISAINSAQIGLPDVGGRFVQRTFRACQLLKDMCSERTPLAKLRKLLAVVQSLLEADMDLEDSVKGSLGGDHLIPLLLITIIEACPTSLSSNIAYMKLGFRDLEIGEFGYSLNSLEAVLNYILENKTRLSALSDTNRKLASAVLEGSVDDLKSCLSALPYHSTEQCDKDEFAASFITGVSLQGDSLLMETIKSGGHEKLELLIAQPGVSTYAILSDSDRSGSTLIMRALMETKPDCLRVLMMRLQSLREEQWVTYLSKTNDDLRNVAHYTHLDPSLVTQLGRFMNWAQRDRTRLTPLMTISRMYDLPDYATLVVQAIEMTERNSVIDFDSHLDEKGNSLLHVMEHPKCIERLLSSGCDPNLTNMKGMTPLHVHTKFMRLDVVKALMAHDATDVLIHDNKGDTALHTASRLGRLELVRLLLERTPVDVRTRDTGSTSMHVASRDHTGKTLRLIAATGANLSLLDYWGCSVLDSVRDLGLQNVLAEQLLESSPKRSHGRLIVAKADVLDDTTITFTIHMNLTIFGQQIRDPVIRTLHDFKALYERIVNDPHVSWCPLLLPMWLNPAVIPSHPAFFTLNRIKVVAEMFLKSCLECTTASAQVHLLDFLEGPSFSNSSHHHTMKAQAANGDQEQHTNNLGVELGQYTALDAFFEQAQNNISLLTTQFEDLLSKICVSRMLSDEMAVSMRMLRSELLQVKDEQSVFRETPQIEMLNSFLDILKVKEPNPLSTLMLTVHDTLSNCRGARMALAKPSALRVEIDALMKEEQRFTSSLQGHGRWSGPISNYLPESKSLSPWTFLGDARSKIQGNTSDSLETTRRTLSARLAEFIKIQSDLATAVASFQSIHSRDTKESIRNYVRFQCELEKERLDDMRRAFSRYRAKVHSKH